MTLNLSEFQLILGLLTSIGGAVVMVVGAVNWIVMPRIERAIANHNSGCQYRAVIQDAVKIEKDSREKAEERFGEELRYIREKLDAIWSTLSRQGR